MKIAKFTGLMLSIALLSNGCQKEEKEDNTATLLLLAAATSSAGDCVVNTTGRGSINTFQTDLTASGAAKTGTISKVGTVPIVGHQTSVLKLTISASTVITLTGNAFGIIYKTNACPLPANTALSYNSGFTTTAADSSSEFATSHKLVTTATTTISVPGTYFYFFYGIPSRGQTATVGYSITP